MDDRTDDVTVGSAPVIEPGYTFATVTDKISAIVLTRPTSVAWLFGFAVACAGLFPVLHLGRPWLGYWLFPYPNTMKYWPQFRSPLVWDVFAVSTYFTISLMFWFIGLIPDLATLRDRSGNRAAQIIYGILAMGWRGSARHWARYETAYLLLAGLATPLVPSVHTVVSFDLAISIVPGCHTTIFPPHFVAGAIYSGFA